MRARTKSRPTRSRGYACTLKEEIWPLEKFFLQPKKKVKGATPKIPIKSQTQDIHTQSNVDPTHHCHICQTGREGVWGARTVFVCGCCWVCGAGREAGRDAGLLDAHSTPVWHVVACCRCRCTRIYTVLGMLAGRCRLLRVVFLFCGCVLLLTV